MSNSNPMPKAAGASLPLASLDDQARWVLWQHLERAGGLTKVPLRPDGELASATNPQDWFKRAACEAVKSHLAAAGIGIVLGPLPDGTCLVGIDLDNCRRDGTLTPWAQEIVDRLATYTEVSPSGTGVKLLSILPQEEFVPVRAHLGERDGRKWSTGSRAHATSAPRRRALRAGTAFGDGIGPHDRGSRRGGSPARRQAGACGARGPKWIPPHAKNYMMERFPKNNISFLRNKYRSTLMSSRPGCRLYLFNQRIFHPPGGSQARGALSVGQYREAPV